MKELKDTPELFEIMADRLESHLLALDRIDRERRCTRCLQGRDIGNSKIDRRPHDLVMILTGLPVLRGIDDKPDLTVVHHIQYIGGTFLHFPYEVRFHPGIVQIVYSALCSVQGKTEIPQAPGDRDHFVFLADVDRNKDISLERELVICLNTGL